MCRTDPSAHQPDRAVARPAERYAGLEGAIGLSTAYLGLAGDGGDLGIIEGDTGPVYALTPSLEWRYGSILFLGIEALLGSVADVTSATGRRSVIAPALRLRMTFDVIDDLQADAVFSGGIARWSGEGGSSLYGFSRRMAFGGAYQVKRGLWTVLWLGSQVVEAGPAGKGPLSQDYETTQPVGVAGFMLTVGVRTGL